MRILILILITLLILPLTGIKVYKVNGISMEPTLKQDDYVIVIPKDPKVGDIVVYRWNGFLFVHRVIGLSNGKFVTKGDNLNFVDRYRIEKEDIVGVVVGKIPINLCLFVAFALGIGILWRLMRMRGVLMAMLILSLIVMSTFSMFSDVEKSRVTFQAGKWCKCDDLNVRHLKDCVKIKNVGLRKITIVKCVNCTLSGSTLYPGESLCFKINGTAVLELDDGSKLVIKDVYRRR